MLLFDDMHHAHADAHALLLELAAGASSPVLFVVAGRPELLARHDGWSHSQKLARTWLELGPLDDTESEQVMRELLAPAAAETNEQIEALTELVDSGTGLAGGNPALLERMVRIFHDMGVVEVQDEFAEVETAWIIHADRLDRRAAPAHRRRRDPGAHRRAGPAGARSPRARGHHGQRLLARRAPRHRAPRLERA